MTELVAHDVELANRLSGTDFTLSPGELVAIVGPNGSGKSSLLRVLAGLIHPDSGSVSLAGATLANFGPLERARLLAYLPQRAEVAWPVAVADMVALGRYAFGAESMKQDAAAVMRCLGEVGCADLARRSTATLSGGELALVALARVFAAETPLLLLDEPTAALDPRRQIEVMARLSARCRRGQSVAVVLHDLNLAVQFADRIIWMKHGVIASQSNADADTVATNAAAIFDVSVHIESDGPNGILSLAVRRDQ